MALVPFPSKTSSPVPVDPDDDELDPESQGGGKMSFLEHLDELRRRLIYSIAAIFIGFFAAFGFAEQLVSFVTQPMVALLPEGQTLIFTEPGEAFLLRLKLAAIVGVFIASPVVMSQVWLFVAPGLYSHEKKLAIPFVILTSLFFILGGLFSHYVTFPITWQFFAGFQTEDVEFMPRIAPAFSLYVKLLFASGLVFQMPTLVLFLSKLGLVTPGFLWRNLKYAVLIIFVVAAVVTPPDPVSQTLLAVPMTGLYLLSIGIAWVFQKRRSDDEDDE